MQKFEYLWKVVFAVVLAVGAVLFNKVYTFQTHPHFQAIKEGNVSQMLIYGLPFAAIFTVLDFLIHYIFDGLCEKYYITNERYTQPQSKKKRCYTLVKWGYSVVYYLISSVWCYKVLCETRFMPIWLGGKGGSQILLQQAMKVFDVTFEMKIIYIVQFGKHFSRFFSHVFIRSEGNFFEYVLHHGLSVFLIVFSYLTNQWLIGLFVLCLHDYTDFALILARAYKDYKYSSKILLGLIYFNATMSWCVCRIFLFVKICIIPSFLALNLISKQYTQFQISVLYFPYLFMTIMMCALEVLHLFWTYYIFESFISVNISTKIARHSYD